MGTFAAEATGTRQYGVGMRYEAQRETEHHRHDVTVFKETGL